MEELLKLSIIIPIYNEKKAVRDTIQDIKNTVNNLNYEIITVDDGSEDNTDDILKTISNIKIINHPCNKGYGAAIKTGIRNAKGKWILIIDADGTYPVNQIPTLLKYIENYDMVVGARIGENVNIPHIRKPGKWIIGKLVNFLVGRKIPDINSGLRVFKKSIAEEFYHLFPSGFSLTTTITLACLTSDYSIKYVPINYYKRKGKSSIKASHFINFLILIVRVIMYFKPLKFFIYPTFVVLGAGIFFLTFNLIVDKNISDTSVILILSGLQIGFFGLIADLIVKRNK